MGNRMSNIATPMPQIRAKFTSKLGIPLSGCKVYTYEPNSNIPKKTWIDIDKTVENTNPILLDSAGEADIFLDGLYQIVVKDRFGFVVYDIEKTGSYAQWDASLVVDGDKNQKQINSAQAFINKGVESVTEMIAISDPDNSARIYVKSFHAGLNKGGGEFSYNSSRAAENDGISVFNGWFRLNINEVTPEMAGAYADFVTDDESAFVKAQNLARALRLPLTLKGTYAKSKPFVCLPWDVVHGVSNRQTRIRKIGYAKSGLAARQAPEKPAGTLDVYDVDACLIFYPWDNAYADRVVIKDVFFEHGEWGVTTSGDYGLYAPRHCVCETESLQFDNVKIAFRTNNFFNNMHKNFKSVGALNPDGSYAGDIGAFVFDDELAYTGTTNTLDTFLFNNYKQAYRIENLQTSTLNNCYGEHISKNKGADGTINFYIANPHNLTLVGCGQEDVKGGSLYILAQPSVENCSITIDGFQAVWGTQGTTTEKGLNTVTVDGNITATFISSNFKKTGSGVMLDGLYATNGARVINIGSKFGASITMDSSKYTDVSKSVTEDDGFVKKSKDVGTDMNNGCEDKIGLSVKAVSGATLNIPSGLPNAWGISSYYGANVSEGVQLFFPTTNDNVYKRRRTGVSSFTTWSIL